MFVSTFHCFPKLCSSVYQFLFPAFACYPGLFLLRTCYSLFTEIVPLSAELDLAFPSLSLFYLGFSQSFLCSMNVICSIYRPDLTLPCVLQVLLGDMGAGKSSLVLRFVKGQFFDYQVRLVSGHNHSMQVPFATGNDAEESHSKFFSCDIQAHP